MPRPPEGDPFDPAEDGFNLAPLGRATLWGGLAALAVFAAVVTARSEAGSRRIAAILDGPLTGYVDVSLKARTPTATKADAQARELSATVKALKADRDRLLARIELLERRSDVTGAIAGATPSASEPSPSLGPSSRGGPRAAGAAPLGSGASVGTVGEVSAFTMMRTEFGLDLGAENSLQALRSLWSTLKAQHGPLLEGLRPVASLRDGGQSGELQLHLVAGPLSNAAAATKLCAAIAATGRGCRTVAFEGQRLALR